MPTYVIKDAEHNFPLVKIVIPVPEEISRILSCNCSISVHLLSIKIGIIK